MEREKNYLIGVAVIVGALILLGLASFVYSSIEILQNGLNEAFFELAYLGVHMIMLTTALLFSLKAIKNGESHIMRSLMCGDRVTSKTALVISIVLASIFFGLSLHSGLMFFGAVPLLFHFNKVLLLVLFNASISVAVMSLCFSFFPTFARRSF